MKKVSLQMLLAIGLAALVLSALSVFFVDQPLALWLQEIQIKQYYKIYRNLTDAGEAVFYISFAGFLLLSSWLTLKFHSGISESWSVRVQKAKQQSLFLLCSLLASGLFLQILKMLIGRQRPHTTEDFQSHVFHPFTFNWHFHSMPSGHSQTLFTVATVCWILYPRSAWFVFPAAVLVAGTRLAMQAHFLSDVMIGSYLGFLVTVLISQKFVTATS